MKRTSRILRLRSSLSHRRVTVERPVPRSTPTRERVGSEALIPESAPSVPSGPVPLGRASTQWLVGDWDALVHLTDDAVEAHPERDRLSLLVACAHLQRDERERAEFHLRRALRWGCDPQLAARLLISGVHNSLGRIAALKNSTPGIEHHFREALALAGDQDAASTAHSRAVREMASLGLLPQAAGLLGDRAAKVGTGVQRPAALGAEIRMLRSEIELLQQQLALTLQRDASALAPGGKGARPEPVNDQARLRAASPSQLGQDLWVLERTGYKRGGFFVEFGATDGVLLSNTWLLETHMGWRGICAEPNPKYFARLNQNRRCTLTDACIGPRTGDTVEFVLAEEFGGMVADMGRDLHGARREAYYADASNRVTLVTESLDDMLRRLGAPRDIDYLSIDTEGSELAILSSFPFARWNIRLLTVEHNFSADRDRIHALLSSHGYVRTEAQWDDWYELRPSAGA